MVIAARRRFLAAVLFAALAMPLAAEAQPAAKHSVIGVLLLGQTPSRYMESFRQALREHGYLESRNVAVEFRVAEGKVDRLPALAAELVRLRVDVLVVESGAAALAAKQATRTIPIVMGVAGDPLSAGVVTNLARPGGNITGLTLQAPELSAKRLQLLKETLPKTSLVSVIYNAANPAAEKYLEETKMAARSLGVELHVVAVRNPAELDSAFQAVNRARPAALITLADGMLFGDRARIAQFALQSRLPGIFPEREFAEAGGFMSYGPSVIDVWRRSVVYVDKILKGAKPGDLPIESPAKFELVVNLKTAATLGLTVDPALLTRADEVIR